MLLFSYLYIVVEHILYQQIKVMKLKAYWLLHKLEIQSPYHIETLSGTDMTIIQDTNGIITGTGTTGFITVIGADITGGGTTLILIGTVLLILVCRELDRTINKLQDRKDQEQE